MVKICLNSIVKNESKIIKRMLYSLKDLICYYVILDTGSTDDTIKLIREFTEETGIQGEIYQSNFFNFEQARNEALQHCKNSIYDFDIILLCDADMCLKFNTELINEYPFNGDVFMMQQTDGNLCYYNVRMIKKKLVCKYRCPTHEYLSHNSEIIKYLEPEMIYIDDKNDGGCKTNKHIRDIHIFQDALTSNSNHPDKIRIYFYLAQAYHCLGKYDEAISIYETRISLGGWNEEIYIAYYRIGNIYYQEYEHSKKDYDKAIRAYLKAISASNKRPEAIYKLVKLTRECNDITLSEMFLRMYKKATNTERFLFYEKDIDEYLEYEKQLLTNNSLQLYNNQIKNNNYYYNEFLKYMATRFNLSKLKEGYPKVCYHTDDLKHRLSYNFETKDDYKSFFNPSITFIDNKRFISIRNTNYKLKILNGRLCYTVYKNDREFDITNETPLLNRTLIFKDSALYRVCNFRIPDYKQYRIQGVEDIRLINFKNQLYGLGNTLETDNHINRMVLIEINEKDENYYLLNYNINKVQKNWTPLIYENELYFIYSLSPFILLKFNPDKEGNIEEIINENIDKNFSMLNGGSQAIYLEKQNTYIFIAHFSVPMNGRMYIHQKMKLRLKNDNSKIKFELELYENPFTIENGGIEYISGLWMYNSDIFMITYGLNDNECKIINNAQL